jgi:hypothetical protein
MLNYSKLGFSASEIEKITGATLNLALATGEDLAQSASIAGGTLRGFALEADQMTRVTDVMAKSFSSSALDLEKFQNAMPKVSAVASSLGITLEETTAMLGVLANKNIKATTSGTSLKNIFLITRKEGMSFKDAMDKINKSIDPPTTAMQMFGKENATVALALAQSGDAISQMTVKLEDAGGSAEAMAKIMDDTLEGSMFKLKSATEAMGIAIGEKLAPHVIKVTNFLAKLAQGFTELNPETQQIIIQLAATAAAIGPLIYAFGALKLAMAFLVAHPAVLVAIALTSALAALNIAASETNNIFKGVKDATDQMSESYEELKTQLDKVNQLKKKGSKASVEEIRVTIETTKATIEQTNAIIKQGIERRKNLVLQKKEALEQTLAATRQVGKQGEFIGAELAGIKNIENNIKALDKELIALNATNVDAVDNVKELEEILKRVGKLKLTDDKTGGITTGGPTTKKSTAIAIQAPSQKGIENVTSQISEMANKAIEPIQIKIEPLSNQELGIVTTAEKIGKNAGEALSNGLKSLATEGLVLFKNFLGNVMSGGDMTMQDFGRGLLNSIGGFMQQFGEAMIAIGIAEAMVDASIKSMNPALAIAGGIALVAAGAALTNLSKKGIQMEGSGTAPSPSMAGGGMGGMNTQPISLETKISGRDLILVQNREKGFTR